MRRTQWLTGERQEGCICRRTNEVGASWWRIEELPLLAAWRDIEKLEEKILLPLSRIV
jgi:hypothetical protein